MPILETPYPSDPKKEARSAEELVTPSLFRLLPIQKEQNKKKTKRDVETPARV